MPTRVKVIDSQSRALHAYIALMRAASSATARIHQHLSAHDLTLGQFAVLEALVHVGPMRANELARRILCSAGNLTIVLQNLCKRRLVQRTADPGDARCIVLTATDKSRRLIADIFPAHVERLTAEFAALSPAEQDKLRRLCRKLGRAGLHESECGE